MCRKISRRHSFRNDTDDGGPGPGPGRPRLRLHVLGRVRHDVHPFTMHPLYLRMKTDTRRRARRVPTPRHRHESRVHPARNIDPLFHGQQGQARGEEGFQTAIPVITYVTTRGFHLHGQARAGIIKLSHTPIPSSRTVVNGATPVPVTVLMSDIIEVRRVNGVQIETDQG